MKSHSLILALTALLLALPVISEETTATATKTLAVASVDAPAAQTEHPVSKIVTSETEATTASSIKEKDNSGRDRVDDTAGAEGADDGAFKLSKGGMAAIIVVVVVVAGGGIVSTVLFFLAKKRQWELRDKLKRASRRVATRLATPRSARFPHHERECQQRKPGVRVASPSPRPGAKGRAKERDLEKGEKRGVSEKGNPTMSAFDVETPVKVTWKDRLFGYK
ncbi:uncharacterized protein K452DRAFT_232325 [Aplosporella prunicola CBS 121167]|uniref:Mid2 domain-containing protein n=1 Tax=Aplosporella prunicola CBS 121167 TaxID=1176127 RepID=A0A6A6B7T7_9PEZI|nr:uncharacterized protein K452DRAFT_232325 [Aplosporella prunicola CBS 121167]KAF2139433.1 hypothetical protein K452DRAFT_232325 [Aplosporella prunicola CBS 121167]